MDAKISPGSYGDLDPWFAYGKLTCFILYLYSMELGSPPLYAALNKACRDKDTTQILTLGPLAWVMSNITDGNAEKRRGLRRDNIKTGQDIWY